MIRTHRQVHQPTENASPLCPECGAYRIRIQTSVQIDYEVAVDGDLRDFRVLSDMIGDAMWDLSSYAKCPACRWEGRVADLLVSQDCAGHDYAQS